MKHYKIGIIIGTTREGRASEDVGNWVLQNIQKPEGMSYEIVDLKDYKLPFLGTEGNSSEVTRWNAKLQELDGFIFVTGEYNHSIPAVLKNAIDSAKDVWFNKAAGYVSYGSSNGARSVEHLRNIMTELQVASVRTQVLFSLFDDFKNYRFNPRPIHQRNLDDMTDQLVRWTKALEMVRNGEIV